MGASAARSRTAACPGPSSVDASVTTAAASSRLAPAAAADATASCSAVIDRRGSATVAAAYVRPSWSRTAAPSTAPTRARALRARVTSFWSSPLRSPAATGTADPVMVDGSGIGVLSFLCFGTGGLVRAGAVAVAVVLAVVLLRLGPAHQHRIDPVAAAGGALGDQVQAADVVARARDRHPAQRLREQAAH